MSAYRQAKERADGMAAEILVALRADLQAENAWLQAQNIRLTAALRVIAGADYRGNRSPESETAYRVLKDEGLLQEPRTPKGTE